jgi:HEAT repeat protein
MALLAAWAAAAQPEGHETEAETMTRCLAELASPDVQARRRAILVIGKYENPAADAALLRSLRDADAMVRRSALVSFSERRGMPQNAGPDILALLADPDVHIRRIASSMLPEVLLGTRLLARPPQEIVPGGRPAVVADPQVALVMEQLNRALDDPDPIVVKNVLAAAGAAPGELDPDKVRNCLANPDREVRVMALQSLRELPVRKEQELADRLAPLAKDQDDIVRRELAATLARCGAAGLPALRLLAEDPVPAVRLEASRQLVLMQDESAPAILARLLTDPAVDPDARAQLVNQLVILELPLGDLLRQLAAEGPTVVRAAAVRALGNPRLPGQPPPPSFFLALLDDPQVDIRQAAARSLLTRAATLTPADVQRLLRSKFPDVRQAALSRVRLLPPNQAREFLIDACLDEDLDVRCGALMQLALGNLPGWEDILVQSLHDPEPRVRETAFNGLALRRSPTTLPLLQEFLKTCRDPELGQQVRQLMVLVQQPPPARQPPRPIRPPVRPAVPPNP